MTLSFQAIRLLINMPLTCAVFPACFSWIIYTAGLKGQHLKCSKLPMLTFSVYAKATLSVHICIIVRVFEPDLDVHVVVPWTLAISSSCSPCPSPFTFYFLAREPYNILLICPCLSFVYNTAAVHTSCTCSILWLKVWPQTWLFPVMFSSAISQFQLIKRFWKNGKNYKPHLKIIERQKKQFWAVQGIFQN